MTTMNWEKHFRGPRPIPRNNVHTVRFGADMASEVTAVLAFRNLWNSYVMASIRAMNNAGTALQTVSQNPPEGYTAKQLFDLGQAYIDESNAFIKAWNQFAGLDLSQVLPQSKVMIQAYQHTVQQAQGFWQNVASDTNAIQAAGAEPAQPSQADQAKVNALILPVLAESDLELAAKGVIGGSPKLPDFKWPSNWTLYLVIGGVGVVVLATMMGMIAARMSPVGLAMRTLR